MLGPAVTESITHSVSTSWPRNRTTEHQSHGDVSEFRLASSTYRRMDEHPHCHQFHVKAALGLRAPQTRTTDLHVRMRYFRVDMCSVKMPQMHQRPNRQAWQYSIYLTQQSRNTDVHSSWIKVSAAIEQCPAERTVLRGSSNPLLRLMTYASTAFTPQALPLSP